MNVTSLLGLLTEAGVRVGLQAGDLKVSAAKGILTPELKQLLIENKATLLHYLDAYSDGTTRRQPALLPRQTAAPAPLSFSQQRLWFVDQLEGGSSHYNSLDAVTVKGHLNSEAFRKAVEDLITRHEVLRTHIALEDNEPRQKIVHQFSVPYRQIQLSQLSAETQAFEIKELAVREVTNPFDLSSDIMLRVLMLILSEDDNLALVTTHHIASDDWSRNIVKRDLLSLYESASKGEAISLPPLEVQYADYAFWQRDWLKDEVLERQLNYWLSQLSDTPLLHSLPTDRARSLNQVGIGKQHWQSFDPDEGAGIKALCATHGVTLFMFMHASFSAFLSRYSSETDVVVGTAVSGRTEQVLEPLIGFFVNDLVLRSRIEQDKPFSDYLIEHKRTVLDAYQNRHVPFEMLVEKLNPERSLTHNPLFQIKLDVKNHAFEDKTSAPFEGNQADTFEGVATKSREDLYLNVVDHAGGMSIAWTYDSSLFDVNTIVRMADCFRTFLEEICRDPRQEIGELALLSEAQRKTVLKDSNTDYKWPESGDCITTLIERQVQVSPHADAVVFGDEKLTYAELNERSNKLARYLISLGVKPDTLVALYVGRSLEMIVGMLAILKAGGAYVPLDPGYPPSRLSFMLKDSTAEIVLTQQDLISEIEPGNRKIVPIDGDFIDLLTKGISSDNLASVECAVNATHLAYAVYTSGSTGDPRAVLVDHSNLVASTLARRLAYNHQPGTYILMSSYAFDSSVAGIFWTLLSGGKLVVVEVTDGLNASKFEAIMDQHQASHLLALPSVYMNLLRSEIAFPTSLKQVIVAGEECSPDIPAEHQSRHGETRVQLINEYGPTEASVWSSFYDCGDHKNGTVSIGRNAPHVKLYVVNEQLQLAPVGVRGELVVGGPGVSRGYLNQSLLNQSQFTADPFSGLPDARLYKTGDYVRWREEGTLEFMGRIDSQVKVRGFRIELREIENELLKIGEIKDAVVIAKGSSTADKRLLAYLILNTALTSDREGVGCDSELEINFEQKKRSTSLRIKGILQECIPAHMIPSAFVFLDQFPTTPNGKIDKNALPLPSDSDLGSETYVPPSTEIERVLCGLWEDVLEVEKVGINDNFFSLGGHSLLAAKLIALVSKQWGIELPLRAVFEHPTVSRISDLLEGGDCQKSSLPPISIADRDQPLLLSHAQQRLWFIDKLGGGSPQYNVPSGYLIEGLFDLEAFKASLAALLERHESLRTNFIENNGVATQVVKSTYELPLVVHDLTHLERTDEKAQVDSIITKEAKSVFDLTKDLMIRVRLVRLAQNRTLILYTMHHIASDGWSASIIQNELHALYEAFGKSESNPLQPLRFQYVDYALWQREWLKDEYLEEELAYWKERLAGIPETHGLPTDKPRGSDQTFEGQVVTQKIDRDTAAHIKDLCKTHEVTLYMFLLTVFSVLLSRYSNEKDIVVGSPIAGRQNRELEGLIGFFVNSLTIRMDLSPQQSFSQLLANNKKIVLDAFSHQYIPFETVVEHLRPERNLNRNPLFQITFAVQNNELGHMAKQARLATEPDAPFGLPEGMKPNVRNDLELHVLEGASGIVVNWIYNDSLFERQTIERLSENYTFLLSSVIKDLGSVRLERCTIGDLIVIRDEERELLVGQWSSVGCQYPGGKCLHQLIEDFAVLNPDAVAVEHNGEPLTYAELNAKSNKVAHILRESGVAPDTLVLVCFERCIEMVVAILAVAKAGGAFVPIDPSLPPSRQQFICEDTNAEILLTQPYIADKFAKYVKKIICLDAELINNHFEAFQSEEFESNTTLENLAYVLYTSGSTGLPKGVMVEQRSLVNLAFNLRDVVSELSHADEERWALNASLSFDASLQAISQLAFGTTLVMVSESVRKDVGALCEFLCHGAITVFDCTPSQLRLIVDRCENTRLPLLFIGGEKIGDSLWQKLVERDSRGLSRSVNLYGPTEACVDSTVCRITVENNRESLGHYLKNVTGYVVCNVAGSPQLAPVGAEGELYIGGAGLARGYLNRPVLNAERFVANPFSGSELHTLYRTGDVVRYDCDGRLQFISRLDDQVKLRGYRIELGEIEASLSRHPALRRAVVLVNKRDPENHQLVAYVSPTEKHLEAFSRQSNERDLAEWAEVFDGQYQQKDKPADSDVDYVGWMSSYTGQAIEYEQMEEWRDETLRQIKQLDPKKVLEIGCGTGILLLGYGDWCESVHATDISRQALAGVQREINARGWQHVELSLGDARNLSEVSSETFDTVIVNSVVQYFPNPLYLETVIDSLLPLVANNGKILLGDIRNHDLFIPHLIAVEQSRLKQSISVNALKNRIQRRMQQEPELLVGPSFFKRLQERNPEIARVDIKAKRGLGDNEMLRYRYDVILTKGGSETASEQSVPIDWHDFVDYKDTEALIDSKTLEVFGVGGVPNPRVCAEVSIAQGLQNWPGSQLIYPTEHPGNLSEQSGVQNHALESTLRLAEKNGYRCALTWSQGSPDKFDLVFSRHSSVEIQARDAYIASSLTNFPQLSSISARLTDELRTYLARHLPEYMVPATYVALQIMPTTNSGKVDKQALPLPLEGDLLKEQYIAPKSVVERTLCELWEKLLRISQVGTDDNFFSLGGHSLLATRLISLIREAFGVELPLAVIFECPTIALLARKIGEQNNILVLPSIAPADREQAIPLSYAQQRLWFIDLLNGGSLEYNMSNGFIIDGQFDESAFKTALKHLTDRHEVLRTHFTMRAGEASQCIVEEFDLPYSFHDYSALSDSERKQKLQESMQMESGKPFDLGADILLRAVVFKLKSDQHLIVHSTHHIASDGWSMSILRAELLELYKAFAGGRTPELAPLKVQYADYAIWQRSWLQGEVLQEQLDYWCKQLAEIPAVHSLPLDNERPEKITFSGSVHQETLDDVLLDEIRISAKKHEVTLFMFLETAFAVLLGRYANTDDIVVGSPIAGRMHEEIEPLIGFFVNTLVLRTPLSGNPKFGDLLKKNKRVLLDAYGNQYVPFEMLVEKLSPERHLNYNPIFQIVFSVQGIGEKDGAFADSAVDAGQIGIARFDKTVKTRFDLEVNVFETVDRLYINWTFNEALFAYSSIQRLATNFNTLLGSIAEELASGHESSIGVFQLPLLGRAEQEELLHQWNDTANNASLSTSLQAVAKPEPDHGPLSSTIEQAGLRVYVLDQFMSPAPIGCHGQLYVSGEREVVAKLLRDVEACGNATSLDVRPGTRLYTTGRSARWCHDGVLRVSDERDCVPGNGELESKRRELESLLSKHHMLETASVISREARSGTTEVTAFVVKNTSLPQSDSQFDLTKELNRYIRSQSSLYVMPSEIHTVDALPVNRSGNIDVKALEKMAETTVDNYVAPSDDIEKMLCAIWQRILDVDRVGVRDNFFSLGGHSLLATRITSAIQDEYGIDLPISILFEAPTIAELGKSVRERMATFDLPPLLPADRGKPLLLSYAQQRLWFIDRLGEGSVQYNVSGRLTIPAKLNRAAFESAIRHLIDRHEVLRSHIVFEGGEPHQIIVSIYDLPIIYHELDGIGEGEIGTLVASLAREETNKPFDLGRDLMIRFRLIHLGGESYVALYTMHHIVSDGWSVQILMDELAQSYDAYANSRAINLPELRIQYPDYAQWQRQWLSGEVLDNHLEYWQEQLRGIPNAHGLPLDKPRPSERTYAGHKFTQIIDKELARKVQLACESKGVTLFILMETVFALLISRYSSSEDVLIGSPMSGRNHKELEGLIGFFVNSLVLRTDISGKPTFGELLERNKEVILDGYAHQHTPFEMLVEKIRPERHLNYNPIYQISFTTQSSGRSIIDGLLDGFETTMDQNSEFTISDTTIRFDLMLNVKEKGDTLSLGWSYNKDLFNDESIMRMASNFVLLLESAINSLGTELSQQKHVGELTFISKRERAQLLTGSRTKRSASTGYLHQVFEQQAELCAHKTAVVFENERLTYQSLNERANQLAHFLISKGVKPDTLIGLCMEPSLEAIVGLFAILKSGGAYVPIETTYPASRRNYVLTDCGAEYVLTSDLTYDQMVNGGEESLSSCDGKVEYFNIQAESLIRDIDAFPLVNPSAEETGLRDHSLCYAIYTSGSSGKPKGVLVEHAGIARYCQEGLDAFYHHDITGSIVLSSIGFDATIVSLYFPLLKGGRIELLPRNADLGKFWSSLLARESATLVKITPSHVHALDGVAGGQLVANAAHTFVIGGETLTPKHLRLIRERFPDSSVYNQYGPTEAIVGSTYAELRSADVGDGEVITIGKPFPGVKALVLDGAGNLLPIGAQGILYLGGERIARGYLNNPGLTAEKFVSDTYSKEPSARLYRTGDLVRWLTGDELQFLGREDSQIKLRGYRIELEEVRTVIEKHVSIRECFVMLREDNPGDSRLVAYYVPASHSGEELEKPALTTQLKDFLSTELPDVMVPAAWVQLTELPLTINGKLDYKALPRPDGDAYAQSGYVAPVSNTEKQLVSIWSGLLELDAADIGTNANFFSLGGHSLLVMRMLSELTDLGLHADVSEVISAKTLADLASVVDGNSHKSVEINIPPNLIPAGCRRITPEMVTLASLTDDEIDNIASTVPGGAGNIQDIYPLVSLQEGIFFHYLMDPENDPYLETKQLLLDGRSQVDLLLNALQFMIDRHDVLRTAIVNEGVCMPVQVVYRHAKLPVEELQIDAGEPVEAQVQKHLQSCDGMDLLQAPMMRVMLASDPESSKWYLILQYHHLVSDHESSVILSRELGAVASGHYDALEPPVAYRAFVGHSLERAKHIDAEAHFRALLGDVNEPTLPFNLADVYGDGRKVEVLCQPMADELAGRIRQCAKSLGISPAGIFHAAWAWVVGACSGRDDVVFGTVLSGRLQGTRGVERALGMFINTLPLRVNVAEASAKQLVMQVDAALKDLLRYEQASLTLAQECSGVGNGRPLFSAVFNYRHGGVKKEQSKQRKVGIKTVSATDRTNYPVVMSVNDLSEGFTFDAQIDSSISSTRMVSYLENALTAIVSSLEGADADKLGNSTILLESEQRYLCSELNRTQRGYPDRDCVHELFERRAAETPEATAVVWGAWKMSYGELNRRANQLAHYLSAAGIRPEARVGVCLQRSAEMVVALLGVLKAGACYVPLDEAYPDERLRYIVDDSQCRLVLTDQSVADRRAFLSGLNTRVLDAPSLQAALNACPQNNIACDVSGVQPENLAYINYTSGSTGKPKGSAITHRNIARLAFADFIPFARERTFLCAANLSFDAITFELWGSLLHGARCVLADLTTLSFQELGALIESQAIDCAWLTAAFFNQVVNESVQSLAGLTHLLIGGEALSKNHVQKALKALPDTRILNGYGPTENTTFTCVLPLDGDVLASSPSVPIGGPIANTTAYVLDRQGRLVVPGASGELCVGGSGVSRGYVNRPDLTAEKFVPHPFGQVPGERLYRTGDLVRYLPDGNLQFIGRLDNQAKIRGFRIEPEEVESKLSSIDGVNDCAIRIDADENGEKALIAYVVSKLGRTVLKQALMQQLPMYMVPDIYVFLESLPLTPNGKLDRRALPRYMKGDGVSTEYVGPRSAIEQALCRIWQTVLEVESVGVNDNFFELGGHSLLATRIVSAIRHEFDAELPMRALFESPTIASLSTRLARLENDFVLPEIAPMVKKAIPEANVKDHEF